MIKENQADYKLGYTHGFNNQDPENPDGCSFAYWEGYAQGKSDEYFTRDYFPDAVPN